VGDDEPMPGVVIRPMLATLGRPPAGDGWAVEFKWDGYRAIAYCRPDRPLRLLSRNNIDLTARFPELGVLPGLLAGKSAILDGEIVALGPDQRPDFERLQLRGRNDPDPFTLARAPVSFYAFDLLHLDGRSLVDAPYLARRALLADLGLPGEHPVQTPPYWSDTDPATLLRVADEYGLEGIVAKRSTSRYEPGRRSRAWIKTPLRHSQEVVIGGWKPGDRGRSGRIGSILLGVHDDEGLTYVGNVGTGFTDRALRDLQDRLEPLGRPTSPFQTPVPREYARAARWVHPHLVGEVEYRHRTADNRLRHPAWRGLRDDKAPDDVRWAPSR
jgi:bifunctional non-homologous end joining protein LigD